MNHREHSHANRRRNASVEQARGIDRANSMARATQTTAATAIYNYASSGFASTKFLRARETTNCQKCRAKTWAYIAAAVHSEELGTHAAALALIANGAYVYDVQVTFQTHVILGRVSIAPPRNPQDLKTFTTPGVRRATSIALVGSCIYVSVLGATLSDSTVQTFAIP